MLTVSYTGAMTLPYLHLSIFTGPSGDLIGNGDDSEVSLT